MTYLEDSGSSEYDLVWKDQVLIWKVCLYNVKGSLTSIIVLTKTDKNFKN